MVVLLVVVVLEVVVIVLRDIDLAAEDRLHVRMLLRHVGEVLDAVHIAVVGDGQARHFQLLRPAEELLDVAHPVEDGVLGMDVQMYEGHGCTNINKNPRPSSDRGFVVDNFYYFLAAAFLAAARLRAASSASYIIGVPIMMEA